MFKISNHCFDICVKNILLSWKKQFKLLQIHYFLPNACSCVVIAAGSNIQNHSKRNKLNFDDVTLNQPVCVSVSAHRHLVDITVHCSAASQSTLLFREPVTDQWGLWSITSKNKYKTWKQDGKKDWIQYLMRIYLNQRFTSNLKEHQIR